jgi:hypothetical protein
MTVLIISFISRSASEHPLLSVHAIILRRSVAMVGWIEPRMF